MDSETKKPGLTFELTVSEVAWALLMFVIAAQSVCITVLLVNGGQ